MRQKEVAERVCTLDWIAIPVEGVKEPAVLFLDELAGHFVGPQNVLVVGMEVDTALLAILPVLWNFFRFVGLMNDLGDQHLLGRRILRWVEVYAQESVLERVVDGERQKVERQVQEHHDDCEVRVHEILELSSHDDVCASAEAICWSRRRSWILIRLALQRRCGNARVGEELDP